MQNINSINYKQATDFDINNIAEFLLNKVIERVNEIGRIETGQMGVFMLIPTGFKVFLTHQDNILDLVEIINKHKGTILLKSFLRKSPLNPSIHEITINQMAVNDIDGDKHIVTATVENKGNIYYANLTKIRGNKI